MADSKITDLVALGAKPDAADVLVVVDDPGGAPVTKKVTMANLMDGVLHDDVSAEISAITEKASPVDADLLLVEDSADSNNKKKVQVGNLPVIHDSVAAEISAITEKTALVVADLLLIEDSADSNNKKKVQLANALVTIGARVYNNANISLANGSATAVTFNSEYYDTDTLHDTGSNTSRLTCQRAGKYVVYSQITFDGNATGVRRTYLRVNGTGAVIADMVRQPIATSTVDVLCVTTWDLSASDYVEVFAYQSSGGALNILYTADRTPVLGMFRIGP